MSVERIPTEPSSFPKERIACLLVRSKSSIHQLAEACYRFSPQIAVRDNEAIILEIGRCRSLYTEQSLMLKLSVLAQRFGTMAQIGFADDVPTALAVARFGSSNKANLPLEALHDYASPFRREESLYKRVTELIATMRMLGLETLDDFARLPTKALASRFGSEGVELSLRLRKGATVAWPRFTPPEKISETVELHELSEYGTCTSLEPLLFVLKTLADRAMARLHARGQRAATIDLVLDLEKGKREWHIDLPVPQGSVAGLLPILREKLSFDLGRKPLEKAIVRVAMTVLETTPSHRTQRDLFKTEEGESEAWAALVGRLCQKLGKDRAFIANPNDSYLPERAWQRALEALDRLPTEIPPRPSRVLRKPIALRKDDPYIQKAVEWHGPERISVEWWMDPQLEGFNRDYFRVVTEAGQQLWVFSVPTRPELYLHGYFD